MSVESPPTHARLDPDTGYVQGNFYSERILPVLRYGRRNPTLIFGLLILLALAGFVLWGYIFYGVDTVAPLSVTARLAPSAEYPLGTDTQGRDILSTLIVATPLTLRIGLIAGTIGVGIGLFLGFVSAYFRGISDVIIRSVVDILLTIPTLLILVLIAVSIPQGSLTVDQTALVVASLAWLWPARTTRSQVLVMRERAFVKIARLSGTSNMGVIFKEMMPNLAPYIFASFVGAVASAILASIGLEVLGLGPPLNSSQPTLGLMIYWNIFFSTILLGWWWWLLPPIGVIVMLFVGLFMVTSGLDEIANPRLRRRV